MDKLGDADRSAILLRYFENKSLREVGEALGTTDDTARKRVNRALEQLRALFEKSGVPIGTSGLIAVISGNAVQAAPAALFLTISTGAATLGGITIPAVATIGATASKAIAMSMTQKVLVATLVAAALGTSIYEARQVSEARANVKTLQQQQAELNEQIAQLARERDEATSRLAILAPPTSPTSEMLKLRGEVGRLIAALNANDLNQAAAQSWLRRMTELKQYLAQHPEAAIPELQYVTEDDWLRVTMSVFAGDTNGPTDERYRLALVSLRNMGKGKFARLTATALKSYGLTHDGQFPKDLSELTPHFSEPIDSAILERYGIFPAATFKGTRATGESVIAELASPDEDLNYRYVIHADGNDAIHFKQPASVETRARMDAEIKPLLETLSPVAKAYAAAHEGRPPQTRARWPLTQLLPNSSPQCKS